MKLRLNALSLVFIGYGVWEFFIFLLDALISWRKSRFFLRVSICVRVDFSWDPTGKKEKTKARNRESEREGNNFIQWQIGRGRNFRDARQVAWRAKGCCGGSREQERKKVLGQLRYRSISFLSNNASPTDIQINGILTRLKSRLVNATEKSSRQRKLPQ